MPGAVLRAWLQQHPELAAHPSASQPEGALMFYLFKHPCVWKGGFNSGKWAAQLLFWDVCLIAVLEKCHWWAWLDDWDIATCRTSERAGGDAARVSSCPPHGSSPLKFTFLYMCLYLRYKVQSSWACEPTKNIKNIFRLPINYRHTGARLSARGWNSIPFSFSRDSSKWPASWPAPLGFLRPAFLLLWWVWQEEKTDPGTWSGGAGQQRSRPSNAWLQGSAIDAVISYAKLKSYDLRGGYIKCQLVCGLHCFI